MNTIPKINTPLNLIGKATSDLGNSLATSVGSASRSAGQNVSPWLSVAQNVVDLGLTAATPSPVGENLTGEERAQASQQKTENVASSSVATAISIALAIIACCA